jgi:hypothetical protein
MQLAAGFCRCLALGVMGEPGPDGRAGLRPRGLTRGQVADWHETVALTSEDVRWAVIAKLTVGLEIRRPPDPLDRRRR